jgi:hypothetical protein
MKKTVFLLLIAILIGFFLRTFHLWNNIFFGYDQARDLQRIYEMIKLHKLKIVGPETDIPGVFNGPLSYDSKLPYYLISNFNPNIPALFLVLINLTGIIIIYYIAKSLFNEKVGIISAFIWAISYEQANFSKYISNASLMPLFTLIFFGGLALYFVKKKNIGLIISALGLALSIQVNFYLIYLIIFYPIMYFVFFPKLNIKIILISIATFILFVSSYIGAELKFHFSASKAILDYLQKQSSSSGILENLSSYFQSFSNSLYNSIFSFNNFVIFLFFIFFSIYIYKKKKNILSINFLNIWLFSTLVLFSFKSSVIGGPTIQSSISAAIIIFFSLVVVEILSEKKYKIFGSIILFCIITSNLNLYFKDNFMNNKILAYQHMLYGEQKQLIEYTYKMSNHKPFSICAVTNPLFINTLWSILYKTYGENKYGYSPTWSGQKQYFIPSLMSFDAKHDLTRFLIIEPMIGIPDIAKKTTIYLEDQISVLEDEKKFGEIIVQKRRLEQNKSLLSDSQNLTSEEIQTIMITQKIDPRYSCFINY